MKFSRSNRQISRSSTAGAVVLGLTLVFGPSALHAQAPTEEAAEHGHHDEERMEHHGPSESHRGGMRHDFSDAEHWAEMFDDPARDEWQKPGHVIERMAIASGQTVADLGAGTGYFLPWLHEAVGADGSVLALDPETGMVEWMEDRAEKQGFPNVEVRRIPTDDPGLAAGEADRILVVDTWHHIGDRVDYVGKLCRALAEGGELWIVDFTKESPHGPPVRHRLTAEEVAAELRDGGLEPEIVPEELPHQWMLVGRRPTVCTPG